MFKLLTQAKKTSLSTEITSQSNGRSGTSQSNGRSGISQSNNDTVIDVNSYNIYSDESLKTVIDNQKDVIESLKKQIEEYKAILLSKFIKNIGYLLALALILKSLR